MSAIFGLMHFDGRPIARGDLDRMEAALAAHGADGGGIRIEGHVGVGQRLMCFTPEDRGERQPLISADGLRVLVSDGRIDNRDELLHALGTSVPGGLAVPDSELLLASYERWGVDSAQHIVGAYAFALWDEREQLLLLARSPQARSLVYCATPHFFAFATMPKGLFALPFVRREINLESMADYLVNALRTRNTTLYGGIQRLTAGHLLLVRRGQVQVTPYWRIDPTRELRFARDADYVEAFVELFDRVVASQLRSGAPVGVMMSGGLDSTAVAATAARRLDRENKRLAAFTEVASGEGAGAISEGRYGDESPFVQAMAHMYGNLDLHLVQTGGSWFLDDIAPYFAAVEAPFPNAANRSWYEAIFAGARERNVRVLLNGMSGNVTISWDGYGLLPQLLGKGQWWRALQEARGLARCGHARSTTRALVGQGLLPLLPPAFSAAALRLVERRRLGASQASRHDASPIRAEFAAEQGLHMPARTTDRERDTGPASESRRQRCELLQSTANAGDNATGLQALYRIESRDPTGDQRIVEFCLSMPENQYMRDGQTRWLLKVSSPCRSARGAGCCVVPWPFDCRRRFCKTHGAVCRRPIGLRACAACVGESTRSLGGCSRARWRATCWIYRACGDWPTRCRGSVPTWNKR